MLSYQWELKKEETGVIRYCSGCKAKVEFKDSLVKRHNANGKNIFQYAIYKCDKGHSWNKLLKKYTALEYDALSEVTSREIYGYGEKTIVDSVLNDFVDFSVKASINVEIVGEGTLRIDKMILDNSINVTRSKIQKMLKAGSILVNNQMVKASKRIKAGDVIEIIKEPE